MKVIILAAGQGTRLRPLTNDRPKCMVEYKNKPLINYILETIKECNINDIVIVNGYKKKVLEKYLENENLIFSTNEDFGSTNMVSTLFCAKDFMDDDLIISYADIIYKKDILLELIKSEKEFSVVVDRNWKELWSLRMENPLDDAETLIMDESKNLTEIGQKTSDINKVQSQYIHPIDPALCV